MSINSFRINRMDIQCVFGLCPNVSRPTTYTVAFETSVFTKFTPCPYQNNSLAYYKNIINI